MRFVGFEVQFEALLLFLLDVDSLTYLCFVRVYICFLFCFCLYVRLCVRLSVFAVLRVCE